MLIRRKLFIAGILVLLSSLGIWYQDGYAQPGSTSTCSPLVETAINALGTNCEGMGRNSACYGTFRVDATFTDPLAADLFSVPADIAEITALQSIRTFPVNVVENEWGVAVINAQANIPGALPGQNAVFLLIGDAEMENAVDPDEAFVPAESVSVETRNAADLHEQPSADGEIITAIPANTELLTDAISEDGLWLRTAYDDLPGWVLREAVVEDADLSSLPVYTPQSYTPMQAFYFRTSLNAECSEAPDAVIIQGPQNMTIDINANGADIRLGSTIALQSLNQGGGTGLGGLFRLLVLDGSAILYPYSDNPIEVPAGYSTLVCLTESPDDDEAAAGSLVLEDCGVTRPMTFEEWSAFAAVNGITLNYPIDISEYLEDSEDEGGATCQPRTGWTNTYTVRPGDTLSGIAARAGTTTQELAQGNCIENVHLLYAGSVLRVPRVVQPPPPTATPTLTEVPPTPVVPADAPADAPQPTAVPPTAEPPTGIPPTITHTPTFTLTPTPQADLALTVSADPSTVVADGIATYFVAVQNLGSLDATGIQVNNLIPDQLSYSESPTPEIGIYDAFADVWTIQSLLAGETVFLEINAYVPYFIAGDVTHIVNVTALEPDHNQSNNVASVTVTVEEWTPPQAN